MKLLDCCRKILLNNNERWLFTIGKRKKQIALEVIGGNATDVTGSCTKITFNKRTILFEFGMVQNHNSILKNYKDNCSILNKIKPKSVEIIIIKQIHSENIRFINMQFY